MGSRWIILSLLAFFCLSGQTVRKEVQEVPTTQLCEEAFVEDESEWMGESAEGQVEELNQGEIEGKEGQTPPIVHRRSAAKKSMEIEFQ